ncbi:hypothetical protein PINS_up000059 [Pythium insidiosum]|nr:hypothetical protein PINS_up000059 [Pythium insidiosum]
MAETAYEFRVYAANELGVGNIASEATFETVAATPPQVPKEIRVVGTTGGAATLAVVMPSDTGGIALDALAFIVYANGVTIPQTAVRRVDAPPPSTTPASSSRRRLLAVLSGDDELEPHSRYTTRRLAEGDTQVYVQVGGLFPLTTYTFTLKVQSTAGSSDLTPTSTADTQSATVPTAPSPPSIVATTGGSLTIRWTDPVDTGGLPLAFYALSVTTKDGSPSGSCTGLIQVCVVSNLQTLTTYVITLAVANAIGLSAWSTPIEASTSVMSLPSAPQNLVMKSVTNESVTLHWQPCQDLGGSIVETFLIEVVQADDPTQIVSSTVSISTFDVTVGGLAPDVDYAASVVRIPVVSTIETG